MIQENRVKIMTRLAIEEKHDTRQTFLMKSFWFNDYLTTELWKGFFAISFAFLLAVILGLVAYSDSWTYTYHVADVIELGKRLLRDFALIQIFGLLLCAQCHIYLYLKAYRKRERISLYLRQIDRLYKARDRMEKKAK